MLGTIWYGNTKDSNDELLRSKNTLLNIPTILDKMNLLKCNF